MPSKKPKRGVTFVNSENDKKTTKRKKKLSSDQEQSTSKKKRHNSGETKTVKVPKEKVQKQISPAVLQHIEMIMNTAEMSVLSSKKIVNFKNIQAELAGLRKMLLQHFKKLKFPSTQLENLKNLGKELVEEKHKLEQNQEMLESLNNEVENAVEETYDIENSTKTLEEKHQSMTLQAEEDAPTLGSVTNSDHLQLPKATFEATPFQDKVKTLQNADMVLKELCLMEENSAYRGMRT